MRLEEKVILPAADGHPSHIIRRFGDARTPFDHLLASHCLSADQVLRLQTLRDSTNPRKLRHQIYTLLDQLFALPNAAPDSIQDVYLILFSPIGNPSRSSFPMGLSGDPPTLLKTSLKERIVVA